MSPSVTEINFVKLTSLLIVGVCAAACRAQCREDYQQRSESNCISQVSERSGFLWSRNFLNNQRKSANARRKAAETQLRDAYRVQDLIESETLDETTQTALSRN